MRLGKGIKEILKIILQIRDKIGKNKLHFDFLKRQTFDVCILDGFIIRANFQRKLILIWSWFFFYIILLQILLIIINFQKSHSK